MSSGSKLNFIPYVLRAILINPVLDLFFPALCFMCEQRLESDRKIICTGCFRQIPRADPVVTGQFPDRKFDNAFILFDFNETVRLLIHLFKYKAHFTLADYFAEALLDSFPGLLNNGYDYILPVPLHKTRQRERGYNQSAVLGSAVGKKLGRPVRQDILTRRRNTPSQTRLNRIQRRQNMENAFFCRGLPPQAQILLIDDVITTGSTVNACCQTVLQAGAACVDVLAIAHPPAAGSQDLIMPAEII